MMNECYITHIGTAVPEPWLGAPESAELLKGGCINPRSEKLLARIVRLTGIEKRHLAALDCQDEGAEERALYRSPAEQPQGPGMSARTKAFDRVSPPLVLGALSSFSPSALSRVESLVTVSCTHASSPGLDRPILARTPVPANVDRWNLGFMGCSAGLAAMRLVHQTASLKRQSLIVACELSSLHFQYTDRLDQMTANVLFSDGAAAMLLGPAPSNARVMACRCAAVPSMADQMVWAAGDHGLYLHLAQELPDTLAAHLPAVVSQFLDECGIKKSEIVHWLAHPGGPQILDAVETSMELPADALHLSREVLRQYGNMSSPTIFFILKDLIGSGATGPTLAMAFGPGLTIELVLLNLEPAAQ